jgi:hypothetical protein
MDDGSRSWLCLGVVIVLGFRILEGFVDGIILTRVLCDTLMLGFYIKTLRGFSRDQLHYRLHYFYVEGEFEDQGKWAIVLVFS